MIRSTSLALGLSFGLHAAVFVAATGRPGPSSAISERVIGVDVLTDPSPAVAPDSDATFAPPTDRPMNVLSRHSNVATPRHLEPKLAPSPSGPAGASVTGGEMPHFSMAIGAATDGAHGVVSLSTAAPEHEGGAALVAEDAVDVRARLVRGLPPAYPGGARAAGVQGDVVLELIVGLSGAVESARVAGSVGHGLDEVALRAASAFRFEPASKGGRPVRVRMLWPMRFRLE